MPMYEYDCPGCGKTFEKRVSMSEADAVSCPTCGNTYTQRKLSRITVKGQAHSHNTTPAPAPGGG